MAVYQWKGIDGNKLNSGEIEAPNQEAASQKLQDKGVIITNIVLISGTEELPISKSKSKKKAKVKKVKNKDLMIFTKKFATMVKAGLPILKTLEMLESQTLQPGFKWVISDIYEQVESGSPLSDAFEKHSNVFDNIYVSILRAGESSGRLTTFLEKLYIQLEKSEKIKAKIKGALSYPVILLMVAVGVIGVMLVKVVPVFQEMFGAVGGDLPGPTQLIIDVSNFLRDPVKGGGLLGGVVGLFIFLKILFKKSMSARYKRDALMLRLPVLGDIIQKGMLAKIAMVSGNLSQAGVPVIEALGIVSKTVNNLLYKDAFKYIQTGISSGKRLSTLYGECEVFPPGFSQMLAVGEETGSMDAMMESVALYYEEEFD
ncbi:MAG: type II secretion system F family protein, partial [Rickettsiales bacterium]|nr:type II secretion system F family protein [Rickettsiales bacterium]